MYRRTAGATIAAALDRGVRKVTQGLEGLSVEIVEPVEWKMFDPRDWLFRNVNTPGDYQEAREFFERPDGLAAGSADIRWNIRQNE
jgi:molybdopterin-guanine dinucleotide biosynthesis protein A